MVGRICAPAHMPLASASGTHRTRSENDRSAMICQSVTRACSHATSSVAQRRLEARDVIQRGHPVSVVAHDVAR